MTHGTLLRGGMLLSPEGDEFRAADVLLDGERIVAVGKALALPAAASVWELRGDLVLPGLVNAHYHSPDNLNTGLLPSAPLELWSLASVPGRSGAPEELRLAALLGAAQLLRGGVTAVVDMVRPWPSLTGAALDAVASAYVEAGLRAVIAPVVRDLPVEGTLPLGEASAAHEVSAPGEQLGVVEDAFRRWHGRDGRIQVHVGPSGPQRCSDQLLEGALDLARRLGTLVHTHAVETRPQAVQAWRRWGGSLLRRLDHLGALSPSTVLAHVVWPEADEPALLAESGAVVVHNPASNCVLGSGRAPLPALLEAGVMVALGTDAATCNDGLSMFEAMKLATILHRSATPDWRRWPAPAQAVRLATQGGAAALGMAGQVGRIEPGYLADLVVLDARAAAFLPPNNLVQQLVMRAGPDTVRHVLVGGRLVVRDSELLTLDWPAVADAARAVAATRTRPVPPPEALEDAIAGMLVGLRGGDGSRTAGR